MFIAKSSDEFQFDFEEFPWIFFWPTPIKLKLHHFGTTPNST